MEYKRVQEGGRKKERKEGAGQGRAGQSRAGDQDV